MYRCVFTTEFFKKTGYSQKANQQENEKNKSMQYKSVLQ